MAGVTKSQMNATLKELGLRTIKWEKNGEGRVAYKPYGSILKGIELCSRSPCDVTNAKDKHKTDTLAKVHEAFFNAGFELTIPYLGAYIFTLGKIVYRFRIETYSTHHWNCNLDAGYLTEYLEQVRV